MNDGLSLLDKDFQVLCWRAWNHWGYDLQLDMVVEECSELIKSICDLKRGRIREGKVAEEGVDVFIMLGQLLQMVAGRSLWQKHYHSKIERLNEILDKEEVE